MVAYALIILNCRRNAQKRHVQRTTWLRDFPIPLWFHVIGEPTLATEFEFDMADRILYVRCPDDYLSLPKKVYLAVMAIRTKFPDVGRILKTDDDMTYKPDGLRQVLKEMENYDYGGYMWYHEGGWSTYHYPNVNENDRKPVEIYKSTHANGRFYFLSCKAADYLIKQKPFMWKATFEDNAVGYALADCPDMKVLSLEDHTVFTEIV